MLKEEKTNRQKWKSGEIHVDAITLSCTSKIVQIKEIGIGETVGYGRRYTAKESVKIATVSIGYADGVPRSFSGNVAVNGIAAPVAGRICMDQMSVDVTDIPDVKVREQ